jgi:endonuclease G
MIIDKASLFAASKARYEQSQIDQVQSTWSRRVVRKRPPTDERLRQLVRNQIDDPFRRMALERFIDGNDLQNINYLELGLRVAHAVGRIHVKTPSGESGFGTGFMISPRLVMTNHHVLESSLWAERSHIEFNYQFDSYGKPCPTFIFEFDPATFYYSSEKLDFAIVAVKDSVFPNGVNLAALGYLPLNEELGKADEKEYLSIIQHPGGEIKQIAIRENELLDKSNPDFLWYSTDTTQGSSGSPVYNDQWQVVALHHLGVPEMDGNKIRLIDGGYWEPGVDDSRILWKANEGARVSAIVKDLVTKRGGDPMIKEVTALSKKTPFDSASSLISLSERQQINLSSVPQPSDGLSGILPLTLPNGTDGMIERIAIDPDYSNRKGFDTDFLGNYSIDLAGIVKPLMSKNKVAPLIGEGNGHTRYELKYEHFSVFIHRHRRMSLLTAVNINGGQSKSIERSGDKWILDSRMEARYQIGNEIYVSNSLDRGHMVRRLDPAWGKTMRIAKKANDDTFHYSNACPQHKNLNQKIWSELEDFILENTDDRNLKVSVLTGPVLNADIDLPYRGVLVPLQYWKVASFVTGEGVRSSTGFLLSQEKMLGNLEEILALDLREFDFDFSGDPKFKVYQVSLQYLEELTGLDFSQLKPNDPFAEREELIKKKDTHESLLQRFPEITKPGDVKIKHKEYPLEHA